MNEITQFPTDAKFKFPWRPYQDRVLKELDTHLDDDHLNIVAAPGSGKTVLGLEVMRRLNKPTLILSPTLAIRNQWIARFTELFLDQKTKPAWISTDICEPAFLTVSTYQGLHAAFTDHADEEVFIADDEAEESAEEEGEMLVEPVVDRADDDESHVAVNQSADSVIALLKARGVQTLVLDEAHHLRNEWWKSLKYLKENIDQPRIVALTATPPFDVPPQEWQRYQEMSGPIDTEISVPELVLENNLCPHQDYVYLNSLSSAENTVVREYRKGVAAFIDRLTEDKELIAALQAHPHVAESEHYTGDILEHPTYYSSILIYLHEATKMSSHQLMKVMGVDGSRVPGFDLEWAEILCTHFLFRDAHVAEHCEELVERLKKELRQIGAIERRTVYLKNNKLVKKILKSSLNKLNSINEIVTEEQKNLGERLRLVILADYIRKDLLNQANLSKFGVIPIFEKLRRDNASAGRLGVLTGSIIIIPETAEKMLLHVAHDMGIDRGDLVINPLEGIGSFKSVSIKGANNHLKVQIVTQLFSLGEIRVLVGTASLLGEGWDAPSVNTLILASYIGSFMFSNQMRGRAIRIDPADPNKVSNIWHLVSVETSADPGSDYATLERRFKSFVGVSVSEDVIESGFRRMAVPALPLHEMKIRGHNKRSMERSADRSALYTRWYHILKEGTVRQLVQEVAAPSGFLPRSFVFANTIQALLWRGILIAYFFAVQITQGAASEASSLVDFLIVSSFFVAIMLIISLPWLIKSLYLFFRNAPVASSMRQIGEAVLHALYKSGYIRTNPTKMMVTTEKGDHGIVSASIQVSRASDSNRRRTAVETVG